MHFSKSTGGFYRSEIHGENMPADAVSISDDVYLQMLNGQAQMKSIVGNSIGKPVLKDYLAPPVVLTCTAYQIRQALSQLGIRAAVEAAISAGSQELIDAWEYAAEFRRDNPKIAEMAAALNKSSAEIDAIFKLAVTLSP